MRTIKVFSTTEQETQSIEFGGRTFGDLKRQMGISSNNLVARGRTTKTKYELDDSILSTEDDFFFLSVKKQELGISTYTIEDLRAQLMEKVDKIFDELLEEVKNSKDSSGNCDTPDCLEDELDEMIRRERGQ